MNFLRFLFSRVFFKNLFMILGSAAFLAALTYFSLNFYTYHNKHITVPDLTGMTLNRVDDFLKNKDLRYAVLDSSYDQGQLPKAVLDQNPKPEDKVKTNRRIYLTINATTPPKVKIPNIIYSTLRNAQVQLSSSGLKVGELEYIPDVAKNAVLGIKVNGREFDKDALKDGIEIQKGSSIDLILGDGGSMSQINVPKLEELPFYQAKLVLKALGLNLGAVVADKDVIDEENALVYRQIPKYGNEQSGDRLIRIGEPIDLFLKENPNMDGLDPKKGFDTAIDTSLILPKKGGEKPQENKQEKEDADYNDEFDGKD